MWCLRIAIKNFEPEGMKQQKALKINCVLDAEGSILCQQIIGRRDGCEAVWIRRILLI